MATDLEDIAVLREAEAICDNIWEQTQQWNHFAQDTIGKQLARSADSIGANIAESYGRFSYGEKIQFLYYSRGSIYETKYWLRRCLSRGLIGQEEFDTKSVQLDNLARRLNSFISNLRSQRKGN